MGNNNSNLALYNSHNIEFHRRALREMDVISLMPRYVYSNLFDNKHYVSKFLEGAQRKVIKIINLLFAQEKTGGLAELNYPWLSHMYPNF